MKLRGRILLMFLIPFFMLGFITVLITAIKVDKTVSGTTKTGLQSACVAIRDRIEAIPGDYVVDDNGELWKGEVNISASMEVADNMKAATDTDITIFYGDTRYMTSVVTPEGKRAVGTQAGEAAIKTVLNGNEDMFNKNTEIQGKKYYVYYTPLRDDSGNTVGMVFAGIPKADARKQINSIVATMIGVVLTIAIIAIVIVVLMVNGILTALTHGSNALGEVADGKLNGEMDQRASRRADEIGDIVREVEKLRETNSEVISGIKKNSDDLSQSSEYLSNRMVDTSNSLSQIEKAVEEIAEGATNQAAETQAATDNVLVMGEMVEETAAEVESMHAQAQTMQQMGREAFNTLQELNEINVKAKESIATVYEQTHATNESVKKIQEATDLITSIAAETNLLSLNASIEAARAGEQGRGFAVVAAQIQKLAEESNNSAKRIEEIIFSLQKDSEESVKTMDEVIEIMDRQSEDVQKTDESFSSVVEGIEQSLEAIEHIADMTKKMDEARSNVIDTVQSLTAIAEENAAGTEETSASMTEINGIVSDIANEAENLMKIATEMNNNMARFEV